MSSFVNGKNRYGSSGEASTPKGPLTQLSEDLIMASALGTKDGTEVQQLVNATVSKMSGIEAKPAPAGQTGKDTATGCLP